MGLRFPVFRRRFLKWTWIARGRERLEDGGIARKVTGFFFRRGAAGTAGGKWIRERGPALAGGNSQRSVAEQSLSASRWRVNANAATCLTDGGADFEELGA
jgi:hypothetical protein